MSESGPRYQRRAPSMHLEVSSGDTLYNTKLKARSPSPARTSLASDADFDSPVWNHSLTGFPSPGGFGQKDIPAVLCNYVTHHIRPSSCLDMSFSSARPALISPPGGDPGSIEPYFTTAGERPSP
ncbi:hypothetical protein DL546_007383 [Coniochaeta pulveracea]|uniref:Uncharacterized protein n=1 Tax=Coniochaeta pulveracea TaxID=177199 RepID=A0A420YFW3_9PEZI|nr:hypothetical protein DL546_007383 [Coniochaeta pulveracea]